MILNKMKHRWIKGGKTRDFSFVNKDEGWTLQSSFDGENWFNSKDDCGNEIKSPCKIYEIPN